MEKISTFIEKQTCASICCIDERGNPYCFSCFYVFDRENVLLSFKSSPSSRHAAIISGNPRIAGTIQPDKLKVLVVKGVQFEGEILPDPDPLAIEAAGKFHAKLPLALAVPGKVWTIRIDRIKMTDSSLGFGKKMNWSRNEFAAEMPKAVHH